eukprot:scaffold2726_cov167-Amphora_coffeaeformis.AAC.16
MSFTALQGATLLTGHALFTKLLLSLTLRVYQFLQPNPKHRESIEKSAYVQQFQKAQANESEYAALLVALLLYFSSHNMVDVSLASTLAVVGQIGYVWTRTFLGYPAIPSITMAVIRYSGLLLLTVALCPLAFASQ